jgi:hypothetical protein
MNKLLLGAVGKSDGSATNFSDDGIKKLPTNGYCGMFVLNDFALVVGSCLSLLALSLVCFL